MSDHDSLPTRRQLRLQREDAARRATELATKADAERRADATLAAPPAVEDTIILSPQSRRILPSPPASGPSGQQGSTPEPWTIPDETPAPDPDETAVRLTRISAPIANDPPAPSQLGTQQGASQGPPALHDGFTTGQRPAARRALAAKRPEPAPPARNYRDDDFAAPEARAVARHRDPGPTPAAPPEDPAPHPATPASEQTPPPGPPHPESIDNRHDLADGPDARVEPAMPTKIPTTQPGALPRTGQSSVDETAIIRPEDFLTGPVPGNRRPIARRSAMADMPGVAAPPRGGATSRDDAADSNKATPGNAVAEAAATGKKGGLARSSTVMAAGTLVSRLLGQVRAIILVSALGMTTVASESFYVANMIPNNLNNIIAGGLLNAVLVPQLVRAARRRDGGREYTDKMLTVAGTFLLVLTTILTMGAALLTTLFMYESAGSRAIATALAFWCIPQTFFYGIYTLLGQVLNARGVFGPYMWAPAINNVISIVGFGAYILVFGPWSDSQTWTDDRTIILGATALGGIVAQALVLVIPLWRSGFRWRPRWGIRGMGFRSAGRVAGWTFAAILIGQLGFIAVSNVASAAQSISDNDPTVAGFSAYTNAFMIYMLPHSLVTVSIMTALFTRLSANAADDRKWRVRQDLSLGLRLVALAGVFASTAMIVLSFPLAKSLFVSISADNAVAVGNVVAAMSVGLVAFGFWSAGQRIFYAFEDAKSLFWIQVGMAAFVFSGAIAARFLLDAHYWVIAIGISISASNFFGAILVLRKAGKLLWGIDGRRLFFVILKAVVAAGFAAGGGWLILQLFGNLAIDGTAGWPINAAALITGGLVMAAIYAAILRVLQVAELRAIMRIIRRRLPNRLRSKR